MIYHHTLDPAIITFGPIEIRWYGLMYILGFTAAFFYLRKFSREGYLKLSYPKIDTLFLYLFVGLFLGARLFYVFVYNFEYYLQHPEHMLAIWRGGLSFHGAFLGLVIAMMLVARKYQISFWNISDSLAACSPIGLGLGRLGNFINGELYGRPTDGSWGVIFPDGGPQPRHPSQLYEALLEGGVLFLLMIFFRKRVAPGRLSCLYAIFYGSFRFIVEYFREPDSQLGFVLFHLSMGQLLSLLLILAGLIFLEKLT